MQRKCLKWFLQALCSSTAVVFFTSASVGVVSRLGLEDYSIFSSLAAEFLFWICAQHMVLRPRCKHHWWSAQMWWHVLSKMSCISLQLGSQLQNRYNTPILISTTGAAKGKKDKDRCATDTGEFALCIVERIAPLLPTTNADGVMCFRLEYNLFILLLISYRTSNLTRALFPKKLSLLRMQKRVSQKLWGQKEGCPTCDVSNRGAWSWCGMEMVNCDWFLFLVFWQDILNSILPPREWTQEDQLWVRRCIFHVI